MMIESEPLFYTQKGNKSWFDKLIVTIPVASFSVWCIASTAFTVLIYEHIHNILKNVTIHIET